MICPFCPKVISIDFLKLHLKLAHSSDIHLSFKCKVNGCCRIFPTLVGFKRHVEKCSSFVSSSDSVPNANEFLGNPSSTELLDNPLETEVCDCPNISNASSFVTDNCEQEPLTPGKFQDYVRSVSDEFVAKLYSKPNLPRNQVQTIIEDVTSLITNCTNYVKRTVLSVLDEKNVSIEKNSEIESLFNVAIDPFSHLSSEYHRLSYFTMLGSLIPPVSHKVGYTSELLHTASGTVFQSKTHYVQSVPLGPQIKKVFETLKSLLTLPPWKLMEVHLLTISYNVHYGSLRDLSFLRQILFCLYLYSVMTLSIIMH